MNFLNWLTQLPWAGIVSISVPFLTLIWRLRQTPKSRAHLDDLLEVRDSLPEDLREAMVPEIRWHLTRYQSEMRSLALRKISWSSVTALIALASVGGLALWGLATLAGVFHWLFWILFGVMLLLVIAILATGMGQIYTTEEEREKKKAARQRKASGDRVESSAGAS